jgi:putative transposase
MLIQRGYKYKILPTKEQEESLLQCGGNTRFLWNYVLKTNQDYYKETGKFKFYHELAVSLPKLKEEYPFLKESFSQSLQMVLRHFDKALKDSFKKEKGFPSFKKKMLLNDSFTCPQKWRLGRGFVFIPKIGEVKWIKHRAMKGKPKSITISQDGDKWYCSVLCEYTIPDKAKECDNIVGCDVGLKEFAILSDGTVISNPRHTKKYENKLAKEQRKLSKKQKGSKNRFKQRLKVRKIHNKIRDTRKDFLHKTSNSIAKNYDGIFVEDLNIKGMMKNHCLAKSIGDVSWSEFNRQLEYKCKWSFKYYLKIDRFFPSSKTCSNCGYVQEMPLSKRIFDCLNCGISIDRDLNASLNIRNIGINTLGHSGINACGDSSLELSLKQEKECLEN